MKNRLLCSSIRSANPLPALQGLRSLRRDRFRRRVRALARPLVPLAALGAATLGTMQGCVDYITCEDVGTCDLGGQAGEGPEGSGGEGAADGGRSSGGRTGGGGSGGKPSGAGGSSGGESSGGGASGGSGETSAGGSGSGSTSSTGGDAGGQPRDCEESADCPGTAPVCEPEGGECRGCIDQAECETLDPLAPYCETNTGVCTECAESEHCPTELPVCDEGACRLCSEHTECTSLACGDDGQCVPEEQIVYALAATGTAELPCGTQAEPCRDLHDAVGQLSQSRNHLVLVPTTARFTTTESIELPANSNLTVLGNGVEIQGAAMGLLTTRGGQVHLDGLNLVGNFTYLNFLLWTDGGTVRVRDSVFRNGHFGINSTDTHLTVSTSSFEQAERPEGASLGYGIQALCSNSCATATTLVTESRFQNLGVAATIETSGSLFVNNLVTLLRPTTMEGAGLWLAGAGSLLAFNTFAYSGDCSGPPLVACGNGITLKGNIAYQTMTAGDGACVENLYGAECSPTYSIAEITFPGAGNVTSIDPGFVDPANGDFRLKADSPAIDLVPADGPENDFDVAPRPVGEGFDAGAFERQ